MSCFNILSVCYFDLKVNNVFECLKSEKDDEETLRIKNAYFNNPPYVAAMEELLPYFYERGTMEMTHSVKKD